jgi:hypothetical protein
MSTPTILFAGAVVISVALALAGCLALLIRDLTGDKGALGTSQDVED